MSEQEAFGPRLRRERERRGISLEHIAALTNVGIDLWIGLEKNDFSQWPGGLFARSFVPGRDGVRASLNGRDVYLTADDLLAQGLYRRSGVDSDGVLRALARELGAPPAELWRSGRFRRLVLRRLPPQTTGAPPDSDPLRRAHADLSGSAPRLKLAVKDAAHHLVGQLGADDRFAGANVATASGEPAYDWRAHGAAALFLAEAGDVLGEYEIRSAARRAAASLRSEGLFACGADSCAGTPARGDTAASAALAMIFSELAREKTGLPYLGPAAALASFLRAQQRDDGGFAPAYDRARQAAMAGEDAGADADAVSALARLYRVSRNPADREAAQRGLARLARRPGLIGVRDYLGADPRICEALDDLHAASSSVAPDPDALGFCRRLTAFGALLQVDRSGAVPEQAGGSRAAFEAVPDVLVTAARVAGAVATISAALRAGESPERLRALDVQMAGGIQLLLRDQLPGTRGHLLRAPDAAAGAFTASPVDIDARLDATAAAGSAMVRCLRVLEPPHPPRKRR